MSACPVCRPGSLPPASHIARIIERAREKVAAAAVRAYIEATRP